MFEVLLCVWQVWVLKAGAWGEENPSRLLSVVTHHNNNGFNSGLPSILRAAAVVLAVESFCNDRGGGGGGGEAGTGVRADNSVNYTVVSSPLADNRTCNHNRSLFSILQSQTLWWGLEKAIECESRSRWPSDPNHPQITTVHPVRQRTAGGTPEFKFNLTAAAANGFSHGVNLGVKLTLAKPIFTQSLPETLL